MAAFVAKKISMKAFDGKTFSIIAFDAKNFSIKAFYAKFFKLWKIFYVYLKSELIKDSFVVVDRSCKQKKFPSLLIMS